MAEGILSMIGKNELGDHSHIIYEIFPDLIDQCPIAFTKYLSDRMIKCPWSMKYTLGNIKKSDEDLDFGVLSDPLTYINKCDLKQQLFEESSILKDNQNKDLKRLPM